MFRDPQANPVILPIYADNDENLWNKFIAKFGWAFADTAAAEQAYADLNNLEMKGDEVDEYIASYENLLARCYVLGSVRLPFFFSFLSHDPFHLT